MEISSALSILTLISGTIFLGYIGSLIFEKTKIPDVIWLLFFGLLVGPIFSLVNVSLFLSIIPLLAAIALLVILFDAGLNMDLYTMFREFNRSVFLAVLGILASMLIISIFSVIFLGFDFFTGLLLGAIIGGTSSPIVVTIVSNLKIREDIKTILSLESILTDPLCIVISIALIQYITTSVANNFAHNIIASFSIGIVVGVGTALAWLIVLNSLKVKTFDYMLTLATLFLIYVGVETLAGSGAIAALFFGVVLGNGKIITRALRFKKAIGIESFIRNFNKEISFFIRSFFFVYLGVIASIATNYIIYGIIISGILILLRIVVVEMTLFKTSVTAMEKNIVKIMAPRGLAAAVLAQFPIQYGIAHGSQIADIAFIVILTTVIYSAVALRIFYKPEKIKTGKIGDVSEEPKKE